MAILQDISVGNDQIMAELARLRAENEALKAAKPKGKLTLKITDKGGISLYGMGRFPVTLYAGQWLKVLDIAQQIKDFIEANKSALAWKD